MPSTKNEERFEPFCKWQRKDDFDILEVHLHGFKRENISHYVRPGTLKISGVRSPDENTKQWFEREIKLRNVYDTYKASDEFRGGIFTIKLPKKGPSRFSTLCSSFMKELGLIDDVKLANKILEGIWKVLTIVVVVALAAYIRKYHWRFRVEN